MHGIFSIFTYKNWVVNLGSDKRGPKFVTVHIPWTFVPWVSFFGGVTSGTSVRSSGLLVTKNLGKIWVFPQMVVPPKHPKMIIFIRISGEIRYLMMDVWCFGCHVVICVFFHEKKRQDLEMTTSWFGSNHILSNTESWNLTRFNFSYWFRDWESFEYLIATVCLCIKKFSSYTCVQECFKGVLGHAGTYTVCA